MTVAICYVASGGYLFQTTLSALQARQHSPNTVDVYVVFLSVGATNATEEHLFEAVLRRHGVVMLRLDMEVLGGLHPSYGRFFIGSVLPEAVERILYLDGDTQILAALDPLLATPPHPAHFVASRDPMVLLREIDPRQRAKIDRWLDRSGIPMATRTRYVNSGVFLVGRSHLSELAADVRDVARARSGLTFGDQDALNLILDDRLRLMQTCWNFPGFLLGTRAEAISAPRIVHFMSQPRPWNAPLRPWGSLFYEPYAELARHEPALRPYWRRFSRSTRARYVAQQAYKQLTERRVLSGRRADEAMRELELSVDLRTGAP